MAQNFIECDREQLLLMPPDPRDWLPEEHLACARRRQARYTPAGVGWRALPIDARASKRCRRGEPEIHQLECSGAE
jgi:hypothetical protein